MQSKALIERSARQRSPALCHHTTICTHLDTRAADDGAATTRRLPTTYLHTHLCENRDEIAWVKSFPPAHKGYLDVYHQHGLTGHNCVFAHCVHLEEQEWDCLKETGSTIAFCPTSNLYLGRGLFKLHKAWRKQVKVGMGTDVGAGTAFNMLQTLNEAYKVMQLQGERLSAYQAFYLATLGGAHSLGLDGGIRQLCGGQGGGFRGARPGRHPAAAAAL
ncbi:amidohydrolase family protein [Escherichia coli]